MAALIYLAAALAAIGLPEFYIDQIQMLAGFGPAIFGIPRLVGLLALWTGAYYFWLFRLWTRPEGSSWPALAWPAAVVLAAAIWAKPVLSSDILLYVGFGRQLAVLGVSPYQVPLEDLLHDPVIALLPKFWYHLTAHYGPITLGLMALATFLAPVQSIFGLIRLMKFFWLLPLLWLAVALHRRYAGEPRGKLVVLALLANPMLIFLILVEGHFDTLMLAPLLLAGFAALRERVPEATLLLVIAACVKILPVGVFPVLFLHFWRRSKLKSLQFAGGFMALYAAIYASIGWGEYPSILRFSGVWQNLDAANVVPLALWPFLKDIEAVRSGTQLVLLLGVGILLLWLWLGPEQSPFLGMSLILAVLFFTRGYFQPWHTMMFWPSLWFVKENHLLQLRLIGIWTACMVVSTLYIWSLTPWVFLAGYLVSLALIFRTPAEN